MYKAGALTYFSSLKKSSFLKSMVLLNFPIRWYLNILYFLNISMILNKWVIPWFSFNVTTRSQKTVTLFENRFTRLHLLDFVLHTFLVLLSDLSKTEGPCSYFCFLGVVKLLSDHPSILKITLIKVRSFINTLSVWIGLKWSLSIWTWRRTENK